MYIHSEDIIQIGRLFQQIGMPYCICMAVLTGLLEPIGQAVERLPTSDVIYK